jgi:hypothetical protein
MRHRPGAGINVFDGATETTQANQDGSEGGTGVFDISARTIHDHQTHEIKRKWHHE